MNKKIIIKNLEKKELNFFFKFISLKWKKNHIIVRDKKFFKWQFYNKDTGKYNFIIAISDNKILGCIGYIPNSLYSKNFKKNDYYWLVNWIVDKKYNFLSLSLINYILSNFKFKFLGTTGCSENTTQILKALGFRTGNLKHLACANANIKKFLISNFIKINKKKNINSKNKYNLKYVNKKNISLFFHKTKKINNKDKEYFIKRYCEHPIYKYDFLGFWKFNKPHGFFVARQAKFKNSYVYKLIDYHGKKIDLRKVFNILNNSNKTLKYEFFDLYYYSKKIFFKYPVDFKVKGSIVAPNFFEPFNFKNIDIKFAYYSKDLKYSPFFVRGDCDQDRPS